MIRKNGILFCIGGGAYVLLELLFRRRSHWSMFVLGGICFRLIGQLGRLRPRLPLAVQALAGSAICTGGELLFGMLVNRNYAVWDYRRLPFNYRGQICLLFSLLWIPVSALAAVIFRWCDRRIR